MRDYKRFTGNFYAFFKLLHHDKWKHFNFTALSQKKAASRSDLFSEVLFKPGTARLIKSDKTNLLLRKQKRAKLCYPK